MVEPACLVRETCIRSLRKQLLVTEVLQRLPAVDFAALRGGRGVRHRGAQRKVEKFPQLHKTKHSLILRIETFTTR